MGRGSVAAVLGAAALGRVDGAKGVRGVDCSSSGCVFSRDDTREVCYYDLSTGATTSLSSAFDAPRDVALAEDGSFAVATDAGRGRLTRLDLEDGTASASPRSERAPPPPPPPLQKELSRRPRRFYDALRLPRARRLVERGR